MFSSVNGVSLNTIKMIMARFVSIYLACRYAGETYLMFTNDGRQMIKLLKRNLIIAKESKDVIPIEVSKELEEMGIKI
jgi:stress response protein YsnF